MLHQTTTCNGKKLKMGNSIGFNIQIARGEGGRERER